MQHPWLHILERNRGACTLCCKYGAKAHNCTFGPDLKTLDNHSQSATHKESVVKYDLDIEWLH